jgi:hypothetical protein
MPPAPPWLAGWHRLDLDRPGVDNSEEVLAALEQWKRERIGGAL